MGGRKVFANWELDCKDGQSAWGKTAKAIKEMKNTVDV